MSLFTQRHLAVLLQEFHELFGLTPDPYLFVPSSDVGSIIVLSAPPTVDGEVWIEETDENRARIEHAIMVCNKLKPHRGGNALEFYLNGKAQQLWTMMHMAQQVTSCITPLPINCGNRGAAHTGTQFEVIARDERLCDHLKHIGVTAFLTSLYHVPRVRRTARQIIGDRFPYTVIAVPMDHCPFDLTLVSDEISKIIRHAEAGDIALEL